MGGSSNTKVNWKLNTVPENTRKALDYLSQQSWLNDDGWYLASGTALALYAGHRSSVDLDFFTQYSDFDTTEFLNKLSRVPGWETTMERKNTIFMASCLKQKLVLSHIHFLCRNKNQQYMDWLRCFI